MPALLPRYTIEDLARFPDDGNRYELVAGHLLVTPKPAPPHELVVWRLAAGIAEFWRVDLRDRCVYVATAAAPEERAEHHQVVFTPPAGGLPLHIPVPALFEQIIDLPSTG